MMEMTFNDYKHMTCLAQLKWVKIYFVYEMMIIKESIRWTMVHKGDKINVLQNVKFIYIN